ncbi:MAG: glutaminyl-peptide cyclotransferase [Gammaproteobacteria bacterium]|nr:glutaminyl-peptide cyclotransferase [Gammaproteobacteria bacterium]
MIILVLTGTLLVLVGATNASAQSTVPRYGFRIVGTYPHSVDAFTQGLFFHEGFLYEGTGKRGRSSLSKRRLEDISVEQSATLPRRYFGEGIERVNDRVYQLTWTSHMVFVYDLDSFEQVATHYNPTQGWGLAWDGELLILSDGSYELQFINPLNFVSQRKVAVTLNGNPIDNLNELEYINGEVWANVWQTDFILRIDPATGRVNSIVDLTGLSEQTELGSAEAVLNGIAWDAAQERLFVTGKHWANLFEIELISP